MRPEIKEAAIDLMALLCGLPEKIDKSDIIFFTCADGTTRARFPWVPEEKAYPSPASHTTTCPWPDKDPGAFADPEKHHPKCEWRMCTPERREEHRLAVERLHATALLVGAAVAAAEEADIQRVLAEGFVPGEEP